MKKERTPRKTRDGICIKLGAGSLSAELVVARRTVIQCFGIWLLLQPQAIELPRYQVMAAYARQAKDSELIQYATEIKVRAERRCGELLRATEKNVGARMNGRTTDGVSVVERCDSRETPTLSDMGLTRDESSRYQQLAAMPAERSLGSSSGRSKAPPQLHGVV